MSRFLKLVLFAVFALIAFAPQGRAQEAEHPSGRLVTARFDRFTNALSWKTSAGTYAETVLGVPHVSFHTSVAVTEGGEPALVTVFFTSINKEWKYLNYHAVYLLADGAPVEVGKTKHDGQVLSGGNVGEIVTAELPYERFKKLSQARRTEFRVGLTEISLGSQTRAAMAELSAQIERYLSAPTCYAFEMRINVLRREMSDAAKADWNRMAAAGSVYPEEVAAAEKRQESRKIELAALEQQDASCRIEAASRKKAAESQAEAAAIGAKQQPPVAPITKPARRRKS